MDDRTTGESPHELLLALAGRIDDDLLAWCRELVAVGEDGRALELITATLVADRTPLPPPVRAAVVAAVRSGFDADAALPAAVPEYGTAHRFDATGSDLLAAAVGALSSRQVAGCRTWVTARLTPAGAAPGPLPQPVVLVEIGADDTRPVDVLAYQIAIACARAGAAAAVEVVVAGVEPPEYQQAALLAARAVHGAPVVQAVAAQAEVPAEEPPAWPPASGRIVMPPAPRPEPIPEPLDDAVDTEPDRVPSPVTPLRGLPAAEPAELPRRDQPRVEQPPRPGPSRLPRPATGPSPVPIGRRNGHSPAATVHALPAAPPPSPDTPALASLGHPLDRPVESSPRPEATIDEDDPLGLGRLPLPPEDQAPTTPDPDAWLVDWISGDWAMPPADPTDAAPGSSPPAVAPQATAAPPPAPPAAGLPAGPSPSAPPPAGPSPSAPPPVGPPPVSLPPAAASPAVGPPAATAPTGRERPGRERVEIDRVDPPPPRPGRRRATPNGPVAAVPPETAMEQTGFILRPESVARLSDSDRELLARLQSELGEQPRPRVTRRAGIARAGSNENGSEPPDIAG